MKNFFLSFIILFLTISVIEAQTFGARAGANLAKITSDSEDNSTIFAWQIGPFLDLEISEELDINVAFLYSRKGTKSELEDETANTDYLEFPALIRYHIEPFFVQGGVYAAYLLNADVEGEDIKDLLKSGDFGAILGAGLSLGNLRFDVRYSIGISDINDFGDNELKNAVLSFGAELAF